MPQTSRWDCIVDTSPRQLRFLVDQALGMLAEDLRDRLEATLLDLGGEDWPRSLATQVAMPNRRLVQLSPADITAYVDLLNSPAQGWAECRSQLRRVLVRGGDYRRADQVLRGVVDVRNAWAHPRGDLDVATARDWISTVMQCANVLRLPVLTDYRALQAHLMAMVAGRVVPSPSRNQVELLERQLLAKAHELQELRAAQERKDAQLETLLSRAANAEEEARQARQAETELRSRQTELKQRAQSADHAAAVEARRALDLLASERAALEAQRRAAEAEAARIARERDEMAVSRTEVTRRKAELDAKERDLAVKLTEAQATVTRDDLMERLKGIAARMQQIADPTPQPSTTGELPAPGDPWPYQRGREIWILSKQRRQLVRADDEVTLADLVGARRASQLVQSSLTIRPSGGRVWVDVDGDAATYVDGELVYLGRLEKAHDHAEPELGSPVPVVDGRRYSVTTRAVTERAGGTTLTSVRGPETSRAVIVRLLQVRPKGGVYRVDREGRAITYVDGRWVYAGKVRPAEWFPGHLK